MPTPSTEAALAAAEDRDHEAPHGAPELPPVALTCLEADQVAMVSALDRTLGGPLGKPRALSRWCRRLATTGVTREVRDSLGLGRSLLNDEVFSPLICCLGELGSDSLALEASTFRRVQAGHGVIDTACTKLLLGSDTLAGFSDRMNSFGLRIIRASCLLYTSPSPRDKRQSRMPSSA